MANNIGRSTIAPTTVGGSVQKRPTLVIREDDYRNTDAYRSGYNGEIVVLTQEQFLKYLNKQGSTAVAQLAADAIATVAQTLHAPTNLYWDPTSTSAIEYISGTSASEVALYITFDPSVDDVTSDGQVTYEVVCEVLDPTQAAALLNSGGAQSTNTNSQTSVSTNASKPGVTLSTVGYTIFTHNEIKLKWKAVAGVTGYSVVVTGNNLPSAAGRTSYTYHTDNSVSSGLHYFDLKPSAGTFTGTYTFAISAIYGTSTTKAVTYTHGI